MTDTVQATASPLPEDKTTESELVAKAERRAKDRYDAFALAHARWMMARSSLARPNKADEELDAALDEATAAERALMASPAADTCQFWDKFVAFEYILTDELLGGTSIHSIVQLALGSIRQDLINLDIVQ